MTRCCFIKDLVLASPPAPTAPMDVASPEIDTIGVNPVSLPLCKTILRFLQLNGVNNPEAAIGG